MLNSRTQYSSSEEFRDRFIETLTPGVIKRENFINWKAINDKQKKYLLSLNFFKQLNGLSKNEIVSKISDGLLSADKPTEIIKIAFELLGHTGRTYVSDKDYIDFKSLCDEELVEENTKHMSKLLVDLGICNILNFEIDDYFAGVQVGLETHRRKNIGGSAFSDIVKQNLVNIVEELNKEGHNIVLKEQETILFSDKSTSKTVDFCLYYKDKAIGIEVNFYTASGSKPTEIKRSYGHVNKELEKVGVILVWITDGIGYLSMKRSLKEARDIHKNIYNFKMLEKSFKDDVKSAFGLV